MAEFKVMGHAYRSRPMDARRQFHVARRLLSVAMAVGSDDDPVAAISRMSDADSDFVIDSCLAVVERQDAASQSWAPILVVGTGQIMYEDLQTSLAALLQICGPVIMENVQGFLAAFPKELSAKLTALMESRTA